MHRKLKKKHNYYNNESMLIFYADAMHDCKEGGKTDRSYIHLLCRVCNCPTTRYKAHFHAQISKADFS